MYKILIAEDETIERKVLCKTLKNHLADLAELFEARNGREALQIVQREQPQIAILDIQMPGISGLEVARKIREDKLQCVIIFVTAFDRIAYAREAISVGTLDYLLKPYDDTELILSVEAAMRLADRLGTCVSEASGAIQDLTPLPESEENLRLSILREKIQRYLAQNYAREISMQDVAQAMSYSDAYFCKLFKECFGVNFSTYLNEYRVGRSKELLSDFGLGVKEISVACGYGDANYFTRVFKRLTGLTPSQYRLRAGQAE